MSKNANNANNPVSMEMQDVLDTIEVEGFDYAMVHYSDYEDVEDVTFHDLRREFLVARDALVKYLTQFSEEIDF